MTFNLKKEKDLSIVLKYLKNKFDYINNGVVLALVGDLGTGKTTFTKYLASDLDIKDAIISPTFIIHREYKIPKTDRYLHHLDLYRIQSESELLEIGINDFIKGKDIAVIEWADKFKNFINRQKGVKIVWLYFEHVSENERNLHF